MADDVFARREGGGDAYSPSVIVRDEGLTSPDALGGAVRCPTGVV